MKSHEGRQRVTKGNVKGHPTLCYKYNLVPHRIGFWEQSVWLVLGLEKAWEYCDEPWLPQNIEHAHFFGGAGILECNVPLLGIVVFSGVCMDGAFTCNNITKPTHFHGYVVIIVGLFWFL